MISIIGEEISRASPFPCCDVCESPLQHSDYSLEIRAIIQTVSELPLSGEKKGWWLLVNSLDADAYAQCFKTIFHHAGKDHPTFKIGKSLIGIIADWSDQHAKGLEKGYRRATSTGDA